MLNLTTILQTAGILITAIATYLLWQSTKEMANATKNMEEISKDMRKESERAVKSQSAVSLMQMLNSANSLAVENETNLKLAHDIVRDEDLIKMLKEIDEDDDLALRKVWLTFIWLNTEQAHIFLRELIPEDYTVRSHSEVLNKMLNHKYVRYLVSNRGYYDLFVRECISMYENNGGQWEEEWKFKDGK